MTIVQWAAARPRRVIVGVVFVVIWGLITHGTFAGSGDEPHYLVIAQSLAFDGDLDVADNYAQPDSLIGGGTLEPGTHARAGKDGTLRPVHDIGLPLLAAPYVRVVYPFAGWLAGAVPEPLLRRARLNAELILRHSLSLAMALVAGALAVQLFGLLLRTGASRAAAMGWSLLLTLSPPLLSHAFLFFTEIPSALIVLWLVGQLTDDRELSVAGDDGHRARPRSWQWMLIGTAIGWLLLIHVRNVGLVLAFGGWAMWKLRERHRIGDVAALLVSAAVPLAVRSGAQWMFWGTLLTSPHARPDLSLPPVQAAIQTVRNLAGIAMDWNVGLLPAAPIYLLAIPGVAVLVARRSSLARPVLACVAIYLATLAVPYINAHGWLGGWAPAARMVTPVVPLLGLAAATAAIASRGPWRVLVIALIVLQVGMDVVVWQSPKRLWAGALAAEAVQE